MEFTDLEHDLLQNAETMKDDLVADLKAEAKHVLDPSQCGYVVRRHFDGIVFALYIFIFLFLAAASLAFYLYVRR